MTGETSTKPKPKHARKMAREPEANNPIGTQDIGGPDAYSEPTPPKPLSKIALIVGMLQRGEGATLEQMVEVTGWLPHTTRAALTGLRKKGHNIARSKTDGETRYSVVQVQGQ